MIKLLLHESKRRVGSPGVFITPGTYFINHYKLCITKLLITKLCNKWEQIIQSTALWVGYAYGHPDIMLKEYHVCV